MIIELPQPVDGQTHVKISRMVNTRGERVEITGVYGRKPRRRFIPAERMLEYNPSFSEEYFEDLIAESELRGRKASKNRLGVDLEDIRDWIEENGAEARIAANRENP